MFSKDCGNSINLKVSGGGVAVALGLSVTGDPRSRRCELRGEGLLVLAGAA